MDDPTGELRRQRELIAAHLRWLDGQIARQAGAPSPAPPVASNVPVPPAPSPLAAAVLAASAPPSSEAAADNPVHPEIAMPEIDPGSIRNEVRKGCFLYVAIASLLLAASVAVAVWISRG